MQAQFLTKLRVEHLAKKWWMLTEPLVFYSELIGKTIIAPAGFVSDFASVPRAPVVYWLFGARANASAAIHDRLYRWCDVSRNMADRIFNECMKAEGKLGFTRWPMTGAVMAFGWFAYKCMPGCLDCRGCSLKTGAWCFDCPKYFHGWSELGKAMEPK